MTNQIIERHENPHVESGPRPLFAPHAFQPSALIAGVVLAVLGGVFLAHQLGVISLGPVPTTFLGVIVVATSMIGGAFAWARRASEGSELTVGTLTAPDTSEAGQRPE